MTKRLIARILFCIVLVACGFGEALACMYGPPYRTVCQAYAQADSVIIGEVKNVQTRGSQQVVSLKVNKVFKGTAGRQLVLLQPLSPCDWDFAGKEGQKLLLYLNRNGKTGRYQASAEGMGGAVEREQENLYWLNNLTNARRRTRISGTVELYHSDPFEFLNFVPGTKVRIFNKRFSYEVFTDKNGVYEKWDLPAGKYKIDPTLPPNLKLRFGLERGLIDFGPSKETAPGYGISLVEIRPRGCGGIDFIVNEASKR